MVHRLRFIPLALAALLLGACILKSTPPAPKVAPATPIPTFTPTPRPLPSPALVSTPTPTPIVAAAEQARISVWLAIYACYDPPLSLGTFVAYQDRPSRWIVEGRETKTVSGTPAIVAYGLWFVDSNTGGVTPYDERAQAIARTACFQPK